MNLQNVKIETLTTDPANVRKHGDANLESIKGSLKRFGQQKPIVVNAEGVVIAGNGTLDAARALGWTEIAVVRSDLIGPEATAFAIADNRTAELAEWDQPALDQVLASLSAHDAELAKLTGFDDEAIAKALAGPEDQNRNDGDQGILDDAGGNRTDLLSIKISDGPVVPLTKEEHAELIARINRYAQENGTSHGFIWGLLGVH